MPPPADGPPPLAIEPLAALATPPPLFGGHGQYSPSLAEFPGCPGGPACPGPIIISFAILSLYICYGRT